MQIDVLLAGSSYWHYEEASHIPTDGLPFNRLGIAAWDHPLFVMLGQLFIALPWGNAPQRVSLFSALAGALSIVLFYLLGSKLVGDPWSAALAALALAVSHTFWFNAVTAEVFTLTIVFMLIVIWMAIYWPQDKKWNRLVIIALVAGLGLANHLMIGVSLFIAVLYMIVVAVAYQDDTFVPRRLLSLRHYGVLVEGLRMWQIVLILLSFLVGFSPWWIQFIRAARIVNMPLLIKAAIGFPWVGQRLSTPVFGDVLNNLFNYGAWLFYQFLPVGTALGIFGFSLIWRQQRTNCLLFLALFFGQLLFWANYSVPDRFNYYISTYVAFALAMIWGIKAVLRYIKEHVGPERVWARRGLGVALIANVVLAPIALYTIIPSAMQHAGLTESSFGLQPIGTGAARDTLGYFLNPNKRGDESAALFGLSTINQLAPNAIVLTPRTVDQETYIVLRYFQLVEKRRPDVRLELLLFDPQATHDMPQAILSKVIKEKDCRPIYLASLHPDAYPLERLKTEFVIRPEANLYRLLPQQTPLTNVHCQEPNWDHWTAEELILSAMGMK